MRIRNGDIFKTKDDYRIMIVDASQINSPDGSVSWSMEELPRRIFSTDAATFKKALRRSYRRVKDAEFPRGKEAR